MGEQLPNVLDTDGYGLPNNTTGDHGTRDGATKGLVATGGILAAIAASACCIVPLALFSLGVTGAWIGTLTSLAPYQPIFIAITVGLLGYGYYLVYHKPKAACHGEAACARPLPNRLVKFGLWSATLLVLAAAAFPYVAPLFLDS